MSLKSVVCVDGLVSEWLQRVLQCTLQCVLQCVLWCVLQH